MRSDLISLSLTDLLERVSAALPGLLTPGGLCPREEIPGILREAGELLSADHVRFALHSDDQSQETREYAWSRHGAVTAAGESREARNAPRAVFFSSAPPGQWEGILEFHTAHEQKPRQLTRDEESAMKALVNMLVAVVSTVPESSRRHERKTRFQELLTRISTTYISLPLEHLHQSINNSLFELAQFVGADRAYLVDYDFATGRARSTHEWCTDCIDLDEQGNPFPQDRSLAVIPEYFQRHSRGETIHVPDVAALANNDPKRAALESALVRSTIAVPLMEDGTCLGFLGLDSIEKPHRYSQDEIRLLTLFGQMIVSVRNRARLRDALEENRHFLAELIENSGSIIAVKDLDGRYTLVNRTWTDITGHGRNETLGRTDQELFSQPQAEAFQKGDRMVIETGRTLTAEETLDTPAGPRHFLATKFPVRDHTGSIVGVCLMPTEITERKKAEEERIARIAAEEASRTKSAFLAAISHELRTPLNAIIGFARILEREATLTQHQTSYANTIARSGNNLLALINDILGYSQAEAGRLTVEAAPFDLHELLRDIEELFLTSAREKGIEFTLDRAPSLPRRIISDGAKVRQILINLVGNAIKFTARGTILVQATLGRSSHGDSVYSLCFLVRDSGPGIPRDELQSVFEAFTRSRNASSTPGTGLGLAITKHLAEAIGGTITVESEVDRGSVFRVNLPVEMAESGGTEEDSPRDPGAPQKPQEPQATRDAAAPVSRESLQAIPAPVREEMRTAVKTGNSTRLKHLVRHVEPLDPDLARYLSALVRRYDYTTLEALLKEDFASHAP